MKPMKEKVYGIVSKYFPITEWVFNYQVSYIKHDFIAGITVGLTLIPQALAYGSLAGLPPHFGLYAAFWGPFLYCLLGTSRDLTLGPTAILSLLVAHYSSLSGIKHDTTIAIALALLVGCVQFLLGICKLGLIANYMSPTVVSAFTTSGAILIAWSQVKTLVGLKTTHGEFFENVVEILSRVKEFKVPDLILGLCCIVVLVIFKLIGKSIKKFKLTDYPYYEYIFYQFVWFISISSNIIVILISSLIAYYYDFENNDRLVLVGAIESGFPTFQVPRFHTTNSTVKDFFQTIGTGIPVVTIIALVEAMAIGKAFARQNGYKLRSSQEFIAIGVANIIGSFFQSYPITGSFSRTAINSQCSSRSPFSGVVTGLLVLLAMGVLTPYFAYIPKTSLSAVIIVAVIFMTDFTFLLKAWKLFKFDCFTWIMTFIFSLSLSIEVGVFVGIGISIIPILYTAGRPKFQVDEKVPSYQGSSLWFPFNSKLVSMIETADNGEYSVINLKGVQAMDSAILSTLLELGEEFKLQNKYLLVITDYEKLIELSTAKYSLYGLKCLSNLSDAEDISMSS